MMLFARRSVRARLLIAVLPLVLLAAALGFAPLSPVGDLVIPPSEPDGPDIFVPAGTQRTDVGSGARAAAIFRRPNARDGAPVVVFLHGWAAVDPRRYGNWIGHLARDGSTVVFPAYQVRPYLNTAFLLGNVIEAVRLALKQMPQHGPLVIVGHSVGGALAADLAASARKSGLPPAAAVMSVYPGRRIKGVRAHVPRFADARIPDATPITIFIGERDNAVRDVTGRELAARNARAVLTVVKNDAVDDHSAPRRSDRVARGTFWKPLDVMIARARG